MADDRPLYERDPEAWREYLAEGNRIQARKRVGADVLFRDEQGRILLVDPRYKPDWDLPGGMAEANEPPLEAAKREVREELGLTYSGGRLLVVDWVSPHGPWDDSLMFIFDGGVLGESEQERIALRDAELVGVRFVEPDEAAGLFRPYMWLRAGAALRAVPTGATAYLHDGTNLRRSGLPAGASPWMIAVATSPASAAAGNFLRPIGRRRRSPSMKP